MAAEALTDPPIGAHVVVVFSRRGQPPDAFRATVIADLTWKPEPGCFLWRVDETAHGGQVGIMATDAEGLHWMYGHDDETAGALLAAHALRSAA
jgi:hypothetical protein